MLDDDDLSHVIWVANPTTLPGLILWLVIVLFVALVVDFNQDECATMKCEVGAPVLMNNECLCVEKAK